MIQVLEFVNQLLVGLFFLRSFFQDLPILHKTKGMTKIHFITASLSLTIASVSFLLLTEKLKAQNAHPLQKAFQSCLKQPEVKPHLEAVSFEKMENVLVVENNDIIPSGLNLTMFGKEVLLLDKKEIFFFGLRDYVTFTNVEREKELIVVSFMAGHPFTCYYHSKIEKVSELTITND